MKSDKELYRRLRTLSREELWKREVPAFDRATPRERVGRVAVIRAVGVAFAGFGTAAERAEVRAWLVSLLRDPAEKVRRYAIAALPKIGVGPAEEAELLALLRGATVERETQHLAKALGRTGGAATLEAVGGAREFLQTEQKVKARVARKQQPSRVRPGHTLREFAGIRIHLRCRKGLEAIVRDEFLERMGTRGKFRLLESAPCRVAVEPVAPFSLADIHSLRCFATVNFVLGVVRTASVEKSLDALAALIVSPLSRRLLAAFTEGSLRYRIDFVSKGHQRGAVRRLGNRAYALCPQILNDPCSAPWSMDIHSSGQGIAVELRPRLSPDPRFYYREDDVAAASHPPLAACMARLAGPAKDEIVWDPFCGSGLELIETALLGGVARVYGTDVSPEAVAIAQRNFAAAKLGGVESRFVCRDFRDFAKVEGLGPESVTLVVTNPPMGRRIRIPDMRGLFRDFFHAAATALKPGGRLVFPNPLRMESPHPLLTLQSRRVVDLGGYDCRLEVYLKSS